MKMHKIKTGIEKIIIKERDRMEEKIEKQQKFIELRAEGLSFDEIAKKVNISKPTLIKWSRELKDKIDEVSQIIEEQFLAEQRIKNIARAQKISEELDRAYTALSNTNYEDMSKKDLINIIKILEEKLNLKIQGNKEQQEENYNIQVRTRLIGLADKLPDVPVGGIVRSESENEDNR
jgi:transcriptional regulator with XRE-family HTH domain